MPRARCPAPRLRNATRRRFALCPPAHARGERVQTLHASFPLRPAPALVSLSCIMVWRCGGRRCWGSSRWSNTPNPVHPASGKMIVAGNGPGPHRRFDGESRSDQARNTLGTANQRFLLRRPCQFWALQHMLQLSFRLASPHGIQSLE
jgi:hypothetical protein